MIFSVLSSINTKRPQRSMDKDTHNSNGYTEKMNQDSADEKQSGL